MNGSRLPGRELGNRIFQQEGIEMQILHCVQDDNSLPVTGL